MAIRVYVNPRNRRAIRLRAVRICAPIDATWFRFVSKLSGSQTDDEGDPSQVRHLLYQVRLDGLHAGDVIDVSAKFRAVLGNGFSCDPLITSEVFVSRDKSALDPNKNGDEDFGAKNGHNCSDHSNGDCAYEKSVAGRIGNGASSTMYVSLVAVALRSCAAPHGGDTWHLAENDGLLSANVRR